MSGLDGERAAGRAHCPLPSRIGLNHSGTFLMPHVQQGRPSLRQGVGAAVGAGTRRRVEVGVVSSELSVRAKVWARWVVVGGGRWAWGGATGGRAQRKVQQQGGGREGGEGQRGEVGARWGCMGGEEHGGSGLDEELVILDHADVKLRLVGGDAALLLRWCHGGRRGGMYYVYIAEARL